MLDIRPIYFFIKDSGSHVELSAPVHMRGKACGLCGDFNQEVYGKWGRGLRADTLINIYIPPYE